MTLNEQTAEFPEPSVKVYETVVVPTPKASPGELVLVTVGATPELSVAVGEVHVTEAPVDPVATETLMSEGHPLMTGAVLSTVAGNRECDVRVKHSNNNNKIGISKCEIDIVQYRRA